jgi:hypothetical protein
MPGSLIRGSSSFRSWYFDLRAADRVAAALQPHARECALRGCCVQRDNGGRDQCSWQPEFASLRSLHTFTSSVGCRGSVAAFLALAIAGVTSGDSETVRAAYLAMHLITWFVIVPLSLASLLTELIDSLGTPWGLFRHYWVVTKLLLTLLATIILLVHTQPIDRVADVASRMDLIAGDLRQVRLQLDRRRARPARQSMRPRDIVRRGPMARCFMARCFWCSWCRRRRTGDRASHESMTRTVSGNQGRRFHSSAWRLNDENSRRRVHNVRGNGLFPAVL